MRTKENSIEPSTSLIDGLHHFVVDRMQGIDIKESAFNAGLIGGDRNRPAGMSQPGNRLDAAWDWQPFLRTFNVSITIEIDHPIAIQDDQGS
jgi:hypothetical protein